jgi:hypothetical protein
VSRGQSSSSIPHSPRSATSNDASSAIQELDDNGADARITVSAENEVERDDPYQEVGTDHPWLLPWIFVKTSACRILDWSAGSVKNSWSTSTAKLWILETGKFTWGGSLPERILQ